jgi:predicted transport protein
MADPVAATITQLRNIQARTGKSIAELQAAVVASGAARHGERRSWLMENFKLGYGDANAVVLFIDKPLPDISSGAPSPSAAQASGGEPLDAIYSGAKAGLRPLHEAVVSQIRAFGEFEEAPKKSYVSFRRKKQFAMVGPATKDSIEVGLNAKDLTAHARLKLQPPGSMCNATTRISSTAEVDALLKDWLRRSYDAAG